jgi:hypothetical protein
MYGHYQSPFYFIPLFLSNMAPWSFFLPCIVFFAYRERRWLSEEKISYLWVWIVTVFVFFSLARGKRGIYILPLYPAAALLFAVWWLKMEKGEVRGFKFVRAIGYYIAALYLAIPGVFLARNLGWDIFAGMRAGDARTHAEFSLVLRSLQAPSWPVWACLALSALAAWILIWALIKKKREVVFVSLFVGVIVTVLAIKEVYFPAMSAERTLKPFMMRVGKVVDNESRLFFYRSFDYGAIFYAGRHIHEYPDKAPFPKPPFYLLMWEEEWERVRGSNSLEMLDTSEGIGPARKRHHLLLVRVKAVETSLRGKPASDDQEE